MACGLFERQLYRVQPSRELCDWSTPLLIACVPSGTLTETSKVALSSGWSLLGNHQTAESGSCAATPPSGVRCQADQPSILNSEGFPAYLTTTVAGLSFCSGWAGVTSSSWAPEVANFALAPLTRISLTFRPKSRLKRESSCLAVVRRVAVPSSRSVLGWYCRRRS